MATRFQIKYFNSFWLKKTLNGSYDSNGNITTNLPAILHRKISRDGNAIPALSARYKNVKTPTDEVDHNH